TELREFDERRRAINHPAHGRVFRPDHLIAGDDCAEPVREVDHFRAADAREEIFGAAGKAYYFVWEGRAANDDLIVIEDQFVQSHFDRLPQHATSDLRNLAFTYFAELDQLIGRVPSMVEDAGLCILYGAFLGCDPDMSVDRLFAHRLVCAERDQKVQR